ncbi:MAG: hypothetical protein GY851_04380 [bacterium]|nr:hypothetical protein [bacterium]
MGAKDRTALRIAGRGCAVCIALCLLLLVIAPHFAAENLSRNSALCLNNLMQIGIALAMYSWESEGEYYPRLSSKPGKLMFEPDGVYPEHLTDACALSCPLAGLDDSLPPNVMIDDQSYFYLGYVITCDEEMEAFADAYEKRLLKGRPFDDDLPAPEGIGSAGSDAFYQLREGVLRTLYEATGERLPTNNMAQSPIPLMVERRGHHGMGSSVLYMDGHVEQVPFGTWPVTERTMAALERMDALGEAR